MNSRLKRSVAIGAVSALAVAGGGAAYAATGANDPQDTLVKRFGGPPGAHFEFRGGGPGPHGGVVMLGPIGPGSDAAAKYLDLTPAELRARLLKGNSLADVAKAQGKSVEGLEQAIVDATKADLDKAVTAGDLTQKQADEMLKGITEHVDEIVQGKGPGPGGACAPGGPGFGPPPHFERRGA